MNILISACLIGYPCRYDGTSKNKIELEQLKKNHILYPICPEVQGGLSTPRLPAEIKDGRVINTAGQDITIEFYRGAQAALNIAIEHNCKTAILKSKSPSCGKGLIYDGTFSKNLINNDGILVRLLNKNGIAVYTENEINLLI